jgi:glycosyltransferase involved in cell wall biosynthesis
MGMGKRKIKIGINASYLRKPNSGIGQVTANFLKILSKIKDDEKEFILYLEEDLPKDLKLLKNLEKRVFLPFYKRDDLIRKIWWEKFLLPKQIKKDGCDIFLSLYQCPTIVKNIPHLMVVHDIVPKLFPEYLGNVRKEIYWKMTEQAVKKTDKIIAISKNTEKDLVKHVGIPADRISISYIDADEIYKNQPSAKKSAKLLKKYKLKPGYILAGGGYEIRKNVEGVIRAYKILLERNKELFFISEVPKLVIYGKILPNSLNLALDVKKLLQKLNLTGRVKLLGEIPQKDMPELFKNASFFAYPSYYEGFGLPVLEAMNSGTPTFTSKVSSLPEVGLDGVLYCHPNDTEEIARVMKSLLVKKPLRDELTRRGLERAKNFSWEKFTDKILNIINAIGK